MIMRYSVMLVDLHKILSCSSSSVRKPIEIERFLAINTWAHLLLQSVIMRKERNERMHLTHFGTLLQGMKLSGNNVQYVGKLIMTIHICWKPPFGLTFLLQSVLPRPPSGWLQH